MSDLIHFSNGGYAYLKGGFPYSQGVKALPGFAIERVRFAQPVPVAPGFAAIEAHLSALGRTRTALCAAELRSPAPLSMSGFKNFNESYIEVLKRWNLFHDGFNPVARCTIFIRSSPGKFSPEPATARGLPGTTAGHRSRNSNLKWTSEGSRWNE